MITFFWVSIFIVFYTFIGYGVLLYLLVTLRRIFFGNRIIPSDCELPSMTVIIAAYNEVGIIKEKILNSLSLNYPADHIQYVVVSDGSDDGTENVVMNYPAIKLMHSPMRRGKINAINRVMKEVNTAVVVFTDANTLLNYDALLNIAKHYSSPNVGAVSGEKRVHVENASDATAGEGFYWKYESKLKSWDSELNSVVGAAGELFSVRTSLYEHVPTDTILDDFMISMKIALKGYRIVYEPTAFAMESASESIREELKRKIRIGTGGIQSIVRLNKLFHPFRNLLLGFQYVSHRVLRWTITPFLLIMAFVLNVFIVIKTDIGLYGLILGCQLFFYSMALVGLAMERKKIRLKIFFIPYYFCVMNYAIIAGISRYLFSTQSVLWEKAKRKEVGATIFEK